jgi:hypothetical protein
MILIEECMLRLDEPLANRQVLRTLDQPRASRATS